MRRAPLLGMMVVTGAALAVPVAANAVVTPVATCVSPQNDGTGFVGYWGFSNPDATKTISIGAANRFNSAGNANQGQGTRFGTNATVEGFADDRTHLRAAVNFGSGTTLPDPRPNWTLDATPNLGITAATPTCNFDLAGAITTDRTEVRPGQELAWSVAVRNDGTTPIPVAQIDVPTTGITQLLSPAVAPDELMPGETLTYPARTTITPDQCFGTAVATAQLGLKAGVTSAGESTGAVPVIRTRESDATDNALRAEIPVVCMVDLQVVSEPDAVSYLPGDIAGVTVTVINAGEARVPVSAIKPAHSLASDLAPVGIPPSTLDPGQSLTFRGVVPTAGAACGPLAGTASVSLQDATGLLVDGVANNNVWQSNLLIAGGPCAPAPTPTPPTGGTDTTPAAPTTPTTPVAAPAPRLRVTVLGPRTARSGRFATFTVRVRNRGTRTARSLVVSFTVPRGASLAQRLGRRDVVTGTTLHRRTSLLAPGKTWTTRVRVRFNRTRGTRTFSVRSTAANAATAAGRRVVTLRR